MFKWDGDYINPEDVEIITASEEGLDYPYRMKVTLRSGRVVCKCYKSEEFRNREMNRLAYEVECSKNKKQQEQQEQLWQVERLIDKATAAIRRDIKKLKESIENTQKIG